MGIDDDDFWMGLANHVEPKNNWAYTWIDSTTIDNYTDWENDGYEPYKIHEHHCVLFEAKSGMRWTMKCDMEYPYICKKKRYGH